MRARVFVVRLGLTVSRVRTPESRHYQTSPFIFTVLFQPRSSISSGKSPCSVLSSRIAFRPLPCARNLAFSLDTLRKPYILRLGQSIMFSIDPRSSCYNSSRRYLLSFGEANRIWIRLDPSETPTPPLHSPCAWACVRVCLVAAKQQNSDHCENKLFRLCGFRPGLGRT